MVVLSANTVYRIYFAPPANFTDSTPFKISTIVTNIASPNANYSVTHLLLTAIKIVVVTIIISTILPMVKFGPVAAMPS